MRFFFILLLLVLSGCTHAPKKDVKTFEAEVPLHMGVNVITIEAEDNAGNVSKKTLTIIRK